MKRRELELCYSEYNRRMYNMKTDFEKILPKRFVNAVRLSYINNTHNINYNDVIDICKKHKLTYSQYQQMESLYLSKISRESTMSS